VLAEAGLLSFLPMMYLIVNTLFRYLRRVDRFAPGIEFWRPYFFCGLVAQLLSNMFNDYFSERYLWFTLAFAVVLERLAAQERVRLMRERQEVVRNLAGRSLLDAKT